MPRQKALQYPACREKQTFIGVRLLEAQKRKLEELCEITGRTKSELVREAIMALLAVYYEKKHGTEDAVVQVMD